MNKIFILILLVFLMGCSDNTQTYNVADVTRPGIITLKKTDSQGDVHSMTVVGKGHLDGVAEIVLILNEKPYKTESISGDIDFTWGGDWYSKSAQVEYTPSLVKSGYLSLQYKFEGI